MANAQTSVNVPDIQNALLNQNPSLNTSDKPWNFGAIFKPSLPKGFSIDDESTDEEPSCKIHDHTEDAYSRAGNKETDVPNESELINVSNESQTGNEISKFVRKFPVEQDCATGDSNTANSQRISPELMDLMTPQNAAINAETNVADAESYDSNTDFEIPETPVTTNVSDYAESQGLTAPNLEPDSIVVTAISSGKRIIVLENVLLRLAETQLYNEESVANGGSGRNDVVSPADNSANGSNVLEEEVLETVSTESSIEFVDEVVGDSVDEITDTSGSENSHKVEVVELETPVPNNSVNSSGSNVVAVLSVPENSDEIERGRQERCVKSVRVNLITMKMVTERPAAPIIERLVQAPLQAAVRATRGSTLLNYDNNDADQNELIGMERSWMNASTTVLPGGPMPRQKKFEIMQQQCKLSKLPQPLPIETFESMDWKHVTTFDPKELVSGQNFSTPVELAKIPRRHGKFPFCHPGPVADTVSGSRDWFYADSIVQDLKLMQRNESYYVVRWVGYEDE